jgi:hypothetical protein
MSKVRFSDFISANVPADNKGTSLRPPLRSMTAAAEDSQNHALLRQISMAARRFQLDIDPSQIIDPVKLDKELSASRATTVERIQIKTALAMLGCIR